MIHNSVFHNLPNSNNECSSTGDKKKEWAHKHIMLL